MPISKICPQCGTEFSVKPSHVQQRFCSKTCVTAHEQIHGRVAAQVPLIDFNCKECGKVFSYKPSAVKVYQKRYSKDPMYCSMPCSDLGRRKDTMERQRFTCLQCGKEQSRRRIPIGRIYTQQKFCNRACKAAHQRQTALTRFEQEGPTTRHIKRHGYAWVSIPSLVTGVKHAVLEHRYVMSKHLRRELLSEETVHHINGDRKNNDISNLELFSSRHGPGQRVVDKVNFAIEILKLYPEFAAARGYRMIPIHPITDAPVALEARQALPPPSS